MEPRLDGGLGRRICTGVGTDALLPQAEVEEDAIDSPPVVDQRNDAHFA